MSYKIRARKVYFFFLRLIDQTESAIGGKERKKRTKFIKNLYTNTEGNKTKTDEKKLCSIQFQCVCCAVF